MISVGCDYTERMADSTILGAGVAKIDGLAVFVNGAAAGDLCRFKITEVKKNFAFAELVEIIEDSPYRVPSDCPLSDRCGGCTLRHVTSEYESEIKKNTVKGAFRKAGLSDNSVAEVLTPSVERYRNNVQLHFGADGTFGFYEEESSKVCPLNSDGCVVIPEIFYSIGKTVSVFLRTNALPYPERLSLRQSQGGDVCAALSFTNTVPDITKLAEAVMNSFTSVTGVVAKASDEKHYSTVRGERYIETSLMGLKFRVSPEAFFQVNYEGAALLFAKVIEYADRCSFTYCADLYCGTGVIGIILASRFTDARFTGVEINPEATEDAKRNAKLNNIGNIDFYCGDAGKFAAKESPELVVVDPPRRGLSDSMINVITEISPENVIYVSCNPFTLARDLKKLCDFGYKIYEATPVNMFPRSGHVECVVSLTRTFDNELPTT